MYLMKGLSKHISSSSTFSNIRRPSTYFDLINIDKAILKSTVESVHAGQLLQENLKSYPNEILQLAAFYIC